MKRIVWLAVPLLLLRLLGCDVPQSYSCPDPLKPCYLVDAGEDVDADADAVEQ